MSQKATDNHEGDILKCQHNVYTFWMKQSYNHGIRSPTSQKPNWYNSVRLKHLHIKKAYYCFIPTEN